MGRGRMPRGVKPKIENPGKIMARLMKYVFRYYSIHMIVVMLCILGNVFASVQGTLFLRTLIDDYITPLMGQATPDYGPLLMAILRVAGYYAIGVICAFTQSKVMIYVGQGTLLRIRKELFEKMESLPIRYFDSHTRGDIMSVYTNDVDTLRQMVSQSLPQLLSSALTIVSIAISMISLSIPLTGLTFIMVIVMMIVSAKIAGASGTNFIRQQKSLGQVNGFIEEMMSGQKVVKVFTHEEANVNDFNKLNDELFEAANKATAFVNIMMPINAQLGHLSFMICAAAGGALALLGNGQGIFALTVGGLASFLTFNKNFNMPINQVTQQMNAIVMSLAGADRVFKLMDEEAEVDDGYVTLVRVKKDGDKFEESEVRTGHWAWKHQHQATGEVEYVEMKGNIVMDGVDFGYRDDKMVLHDISLYAHPGQKIAFVGSTGAGKTTIMNLITRFYDIQDGKIRYDGININKIRKSDLRRSLGMVLQDTNLFTGTVRDNIRFGKLDATDEEIVAAAKLANADGFITRLPDGYDTMLTGGGENLSQGQRQLLAIARAAVANPPVLILDEATSSIDSRTERIVQDGMDKLMKGRTTFVIAHRLSTIKNSDCIMVMENGRIIERGTHDDLLEEKGKYYELYTGKAVAT
ncbi:MAG: ABC transporter ATP-binding protein [Lachnospiraceae bacterium]|nr:ABC transporter ATP-binding protein [Candidatus Equihabitans merdae]